ncbi:MAG TPA: S41 family peptidase [Bacteroidales bacterium]|nr:S41 family peptidase [Bacteroidales bacterium]
MKTPIKFLLPFFLVTGLLLSCRNDDNKNDHIEKVNADILELMREVYLWYSYLPANIDPSDYSNPVDFMEALRYPQFDRWSTVLTEEEFNMYFEAGEMIGHGIMPGLDASDNIRVVFVYPGTEAAEKGVKRGWIIQKANGTNLTASNFYSQMGEDEVGVTNNLTFLDNDGQPVSLSLTKEILEINPVLHSEVIEQGVDKIGYLVFQDFIDAANAELDAAFNNFVTAGINELIVDMRYNGGGSSDVALHLAGWLIGKDFGGEPFIYYEHNDILNKDPYNLDTMYTVPVKSNGLSLSRIFFIGTDNTASASELIINGVDPFIEAILAGSSTHGKPVGMYAIPIEEYVTLPVTFKYTNKNHAGDFYNGIQPTIPANDDITRDFGDREEASLKAVLDYIETGVLTSESTKSTAFRTKYIERREPIGQFLKAF